jgi:NADH:ubiquinone oxidoreductase subunit F (NADH-binding)
VLFDESVSPVEFALYLTEFSRYESCGKCSPCRLGCPALVEILQRIVNGQGQPGDLELIERHSRAMIRLSLCGLGKAAPAPVLGFLRFYRPEFERMIFDKPAVLPSAQAIRPNPRAATALPTDARGRPVIPLAATGSDG